MGAPWLSLRKGLAVSWLCYAPGDRATPPRAQTLVVARSSPLVVTKTRKQVGKLPNPARLEEDTPSISHMRLSGFLLTRLRRSKQRTSGADKEGKAYVCSNDGPGSRRGPPSGKRYSVPPQDNLSTSMKL